MKITTDLNSLAVRCRKGALLLALTSCVGLGWAQDDSQRRESENRTAETAPVAPTPGQLRPSERAFLEQARALLRQQRRLGELGVGNASSSEVRGHAQQIAADSRRLSEELEGLLRKKGIALIAAGEPATDAPPAVAKKSGADFDRAFVLMLADLHESTSTLFEAATADAKDVDIREFASAQLPMLRGHRNQITRLRALFD